jgi:transposase-like protein
MARRTFNPEKIINLLREAEVLLSQGQALDVVCRKLSITRQIYYRWRKSCGDERGIYEGLAGPLRTIQPSSRPGAI